jgi:threonine dehydrogenase-like Zn-dependent dehydrogenase
MKAVVFHDIGDIRLDEVPEPAPAQAEDQKEEFQEEVGKVAPHRHPDGDNWVPGDAPSQARQWAVQALAEAGTLAVIGVYPPADHAFPIGAAMNKNLTIPMGNCNHRKYVPDLVESRDGRVG